MITNYGGEYPFKMTELYDKLGLHPARYSKWVKINLLGSFYEGENYNLILLNPRLSNPNRGRFRQDYALTKRTAEEMALLAKTPESKALRKWLLDINDAVENYEYLSQKQVLFLIDLINIFSFIKHQNAATTAHLNRFIDDHGGAPNRWLCAKFHNMRNELLHISQEEIDERVKRYFDEEGRILDEMSKRDIIAVLNKYELIGHASFDYMKALGRPSQTALTVMEIVSKMVIRIQPAMKKENVDDLFGNKLELNPKLMKSLATRANNLQLLN